MVVWTGRASAGSAGSADRRWAQHGEFVDREVGPAVVVSNLRRSRTLCARTNPPGVATRSRYPRSRHHAFEPFPDQVVVVGEPQPRDGEPVASVRAASSQMSRISLRSCATPVQPAARGVDDAIESSTVTNCAPPGCRSISVRRDVGRINASDPSPRVSGSRFVDTWTVSRHRRSAAW